MSRYKNTRATETVNVDLIVPPFKVIKGKIIPAERVDGRWVYRSRFTDEA